MTNQQMHETGFWDGYVQRHGDDYVNVRRREYPDKTRHFDPYWTVQSGLGLEVGSGCVSCLDGCGKTFISLDPLMDYYLTLVQPEMWHTSCSDSPLCYMAGDGERLPFSDSHFDWVFCVNTIDHTPNPDVALREMRRVLKSGGTFFFEVHFDDTLSPAHYGLWSHEVVHDLVCPVFRYPVQSSTVRLDEHNQYNYWAVYTT